MSDAVLLLAYGGPDSLDDIPAYLLDVRGGRETPPRLLEQVTERYRQIGGRTPLTEITRSTAARLQDVVGMPVYVGMRHWRPSICQAVTHMAASGVRRCVAVCMAPQFSEMSVGAYRAKLSEVIHETSSAGRELAVTFVESWHTQPHYLEGIAANVRETLSRFPAALRDRVLVIFTAHSLPESVLERCDPYPVQVRETAALVAERLGLASARWTFGFQSARQDGMPWLGPQIEVLVPELAQAGERGLLIAPIGFVADNMEVLYDLDISVQRIARSAGMRLERTPMLNDSPALVNALADVVRSHSKP
jgi:ferrochelatase